MSAELEVFEAYIEAASCAKSTKLFRNAGEVVERWTPSKSCGCCRSSR